MFRQSELHEWQLQNFGKPTVEHMALGVCEEAGELAHAVLKMQQKIREGTNLEKAKAMIADAFADMIVFGCQLLTILEIDAEKAYHETVCEVLKRDWKNNSTGAGYSQHNQEH